MTTFNSRPRRQRTHSNLSGMFASTGQSADSLTVPVVTRTNSVMSLASSTASANSQGNDGTASLALSRRLRRMKRRLLLEAVAGDAATTTHSLSDRRTMKRDDSLSSMSDNSAD